MFMVLGLLACLMVADAPAQCVKNADGTITCPVLAPPLPPAVAAEAAASQSSATVDEAAVYQANLDEAAGRLEKRQRRAIGVTLRSCLSHAIDLAKAGVLDHENADIAAGQIALSMNAEDPRAFAGADWDAILAFIEKLIPIIMAFLSMLGL
jgi:hypothetical protein